MRDPEESTTSRVIPFGKEEPTVPRRRRPRSRRVWALGAGVVLVAFGYIATAAPAPRLAWREGTAPQEHLNADSVVTTPTGFSILGGPDRSGGVVWSTTDGDRWIARTLPRLSRRIVYHHTGLYVVDGRQVSRIGPDGDDPTLRIDLPDAIRLGYGSRRLGLLAVRDGLLAQTVAGDLYWSADGRHFDQVVEASTWGADADVTPSPAVVSEVAPGRVRSVCRPLARRAPDVPPVVEAATLVALIPESDPSVVWPVCEPVLWSSPDGVTWTAVSETSPFPDGAYVFDMAWRAGRYVAVGGIGYDRPLVWTSRDGREWEEVEAVDPVASIDLTDVEAGPLGWVVVGTPRDGSPRVGWYSPDGVCWEPVPDGVAGRGIAVGVDRVVMVDGEPSIVWIGTPTRSLLPFHRCL